MKLPSNTINSEYMSFQMKVWENMLFGYMQHYAQANKGGGMHAWWVVRGGKGDIKYLVGRLVLLTILMTQINIVTIYSYKYCYNTNTFAAWNI